MVGTEVSRSQLDQPANHSPQQSYLSRDSWRRPYEFACAPCTARVTLTEVTSVYNLAAYIGGMGFIETHKAECMLSVLINTHLLMAARDAGVERYFYAPSACVYNGDKQKEADVVALKESGAYPALPEDGYGWETLFSERTCRHFREDYGIETRVARYHNVYGPQGTFDGGREKAPAAICRKVAESVISGRHDIEIWGDGEQTNQWIYDQIKTPRAERDPAYR